MSYTLGTAAKAAGLSKPTIHRAIRSGRISATRLDDGSYRIDPAELHRVFPPVSSVPVTPGGTENSVRQSETPFVTAVPPVTHDSAVQAARLEAELAGVRELLRVREEQIEILTQVHRDQIADLRTERDKLLSQVDAAHRLLTHQTVTKPNAHPVAIERRGWWPFRRRA